MSIERTGAGGAGDASGDLEAEGAAPPEAPGAAAGGAPAAAPSASGATWANAALPGDVLRAQLATWPGPAAEGALETSAGGAAAAPVAADSAWAKVYDLRSDAGRFNHHIHGIPPEVKQALDILDPMPIGGAFDRFMTDMPDYAMKKFLEGVSRAEPEQMQRFEAWVADPRCSPEVKQRVFETFEAEAAEPSDRGRAASEMMADLVERDPKTCEKLLAKNPEFLRDHPNVAEALASRDPSTFAVFVAARPKFLEDPRFARVAGEHLTAPDLGKILNAWKSTGGYDDAKGHLAAMGYLFQNFLQAHDDPKAAVAKFMKQAGEAGLLNDPEDFGMIAGGLIAGMKRTCADEKATEERAKQIFEAVSGGLDLATAGVGEGVKPFLEAIKLGVEAGKALTSSGQQPDLDVIGDHMWAAIGNGLTRNPPEAWTDWVDPVEARRGAKVKTSAEDRARASMDDVVRASRYGG
jgi:hypothetical protein